MTRVAFLIVGFVCAVPLSAGVAGWVGSTSQAGSTGALADMVLLLERHGEPNEAAERILSSPGFDDHTILARLLTLTGRHAEADSILALHTPIGDDRALFFHSLWRARLCVLGGDYETARTLLAGVESKEVAGFAVYADFLRAQAALSLGLFDEAVLAAERARNGTVPDALVAELSEIIIGAYAALERFDDARTVLDAARGVNWRGEDAQRLLMAAFEFYADAGDDKKARETATRLARRFPRGRSTRTAVDEVLRAIPIGEIPNRDVIAFIEYATVTGDAKLARRLLRSTRDRKWSPAQGEERQLLQTRLHYGAGEYDKAASLAKKPYSRLSARRLSTLYLARSYRRLGRRADAARVYEYFARTFPNDRKAAETLFVAASLYDDLDNYAAGDRVRAKLRKSYPSSYHGRTVSIHSALSHAERGDYAKATELLSRRVRRSRGTDEAAIYHLAAVKRKVGDQKRSNELLDQLRAIDPYSFYLFPDIPRSYRRPVMMAARVVALDGDDGLIAFLKKADAARDRATRRIETALEKAPDGEAPAGFIPCIDRANIFLESGLRDWAEGELEEARGRCGSSPMAMLALARVYEKWAMPWRSVRLYQRVKDAIHWKVRRDYDEDFRWLLYPTPFPVQILENSDRYDLAPHLIYAMMREESRFDIDAVSRVGALGLMQLMPETGRFVARQLELPELAEERLLDPEVNLAFGTWYAQSLLEKSDGNPLRMLAAYNAGPGNAKRWFDRQPEKDPRELVDGIDYRETRGYVRRIVESANVYYALYFTPRAASGSSP